MSCHNDSSFIEELFAFLGFVLLLGFIALGAIKGNEAYQSYEENNKKKYISWVDHMEYNSCKVVEQTSDNVIKCYLCDSIKICYEE